MRTVAQRLLKVLLGSLCLFCAFAAPAEPLVFGVVPQQSTHRLAKTWTPLLVELGHLMDTRVTFATAKDIPAFEQLLASGFYDIAYMNPYHYTVFSQRSGYRALAKQKNKTLQGIVVVHRDSEITDLSELNNRMLAFPAPAAFAATIIVQAELKRRGVAVRSRYVSSHDSVYLNVARQFMPAGGGVLQTLEAAPTDVQNNLKVLWRSRAYPSHAIATSATVSATLRARLLDALLTISEDPDFAHLLDDINFTGFESADDAEWDDVRDMNIQRKTVSVR